MGFNKNLLLIVSFSSLLISVLAVSFVPSDSTSAAPTTSQVNPFEEILKATTEQILNIHEPKVLEFCSGTENPTLCADTISPFVSGHFDPFNALEKEIEATYNQSVKIHQSFTKALRDPATTKVAQPVIELCQKIYDNMVESIEETMELMSKRNVVDAYYKLNSVLADRSTCDDAFAETPGTENPFFDDCQTVYQLGGNCMAIMDGLVNNHNKYLF